MYAVTIALYHMELESNPERTSQRLTTYTQVFNWHDIDSSSSFEDYVIIDNLNEDIALNILYVSFREINICPEYISKSNFNTKNQKNC